MRSVAMTRDALGLVTPGCLADPIGDDHVGHLGPVDGLPHCLLLAVRSRMISCSDLDEYDVAADAARAQLDVVLALGRLAHAVELVAQRTGDGVDVSPHGSTDRNADLHVPGNVAGGDLAAGRGSDGQVA